MIKKPDISTIAEELFNANVQIRFDLETPDMNSAVLGTINNWELIRAPQFWMAITEPKYGLELEKAREMHYRKIPGTNTNYGTIIRPSGDFMQRDPKYFAMPIDSKGRIIVEDPLGIHRDFVERTGKKPVRDAIYVTTKEGIIYTERIHQYNIDTHKGLVEFKNTIRNNKTS